MARQKPSSKWSAQRLAAAGLACLLLGYSAISWAKHEETTSGRLPASGATLKVARLASPSSAGLPQQGAAPSKKRGVIKIATIGPRPVAVNPDAEPQTAVDKMIAFWRGRFAQVLPDRPDLIVVPEACDRPAGFALDKRLEYYRVRKDQIQKFFARVAKENNCYMVYSAAREMKDGTWRNSSVLLDRTGKVAGVYNKNHVVIEETTKAGILCGRDATIVDCDFGRVGFAICFDLNFDELRLKYVNAKPDLLIFSSMYHGGLMQAYWAYSCRCHFVAALAGLPCEIHNPLGQVIASSTNYRDFAVAAVNLDCRLAHLDYNGGRLKALKAKYGPKVTIRDPGYLGSVLITSEDQKISVDDMIKEFDIELLDDYMARALAHRHAPGNME
jgi:predicted amidohydrolase